MSQKITAKKEAQESPARIEPAFIEGGVPDRVADLAGDVIASAAAFGSSFHPRTAASLAALVRIMNAYYSNLIEGHNTRPADIVKALEGHYSGTAEQRDLQIEAASHVRVQATIDHLASIDALPEPAGIDFIRELHRGFYDGASRAALTIANMNERYQMAPGAFRSEALHDVVVGRHQPPSSQSVETFMTYFSGRFRLKEKRKLTGLLVAAAAHHRFNYIHPFSDGNGRVSRLLSHAMLQYVGVGAHGLWSISRGLARGIGDRDEYKRRLDAADAPRDNDVDGRGNLSQRALIEWTAWFLEVCLDQIRFMSSLFELNRLGERLRNYATRETELGEGGARLLEEAAIRGELSRGDISRITGQPERTARRTLNDLISRGLVASETPRGPVSLRFTLELAQAVFPQIFSPSGATQDGFR